MKLTSKVFFKKKNMTSEVMNPAISSRADLFKELNREIVWEAGGGKHLEVSPKHVVTQNLSTGGPIIFDLPFIYKGSYNFPQSYLKFK